MRASRALASGSARAKRQSVALGLVKELLVVELREFEHGLR
ncbi:hypothetical protein [Hamadaea sp.]|nr:hypothetical protein [Hamadaea sp.]